MKKLLALMLSLAMALSICVPTAFAADADIDNFKKINTYTDQFSDISGWAVPVIQTCYEYGLMNGKGEGTFAPKGNLTVAEALVMACRVHEIYNTGVSTLTNGSPWYQPYVDYALANGIIAEGDFSAYNVNVTRAQMAYIFSGSLPAVEFTALKAVSSLPDVTENASYYEEILSLYTAGILTGSDAFGTFKPNDSITRQEAAAIIARVAIPSMRSSAPLVETITIADSITIAIPHGSSLYTDDAGTVNCEGNDYGVYVTRSTGYDGLNLPDLFTKEAIEATLFSGISDQILPNSLSTESISVGKENGYRSTFLTVADGLTVRFVVTIFVHNGSLTLVQCAAEDGSSLLTTMVNSLRFSGTAVSPAM